ncbi:hypothetical protein [Catenuloplanes japonicus]|uniref:hypothetical protein n=1 Tax=Catenuloplanes japonicus TaxID=33876 RepID=UPI000527CC40|nr:hypothetical protein [Catenuloplanes japonicus]
MLSIDEYAISVVTDGAESTAEDDLNENDDIAEEDHRAAIARAYRIIWAIRAYPNEILALADRHTAEHPGDAA